MHRSVMNSEYICILKQILIEASSVVYKSDFELIKRDVSERTICARLAFNMELQMKQHRQMDGYYCDVEFNRVIQNNINSKKYVNGKRKILDLIVHSRWSKELDNLLVLEMKKIHGSNKVADRNKISILTDTVKVDGNPKYLLGIYYEYSCTNLIIEYYTEGKCVEKIIYTVENGEILVV